jgi:hypothetical protein
MVEASLAAVGEESKLVADPAIATVELGLSISNPSILYK